MSNNTKFSNYATSRVNAELVDAKLFARHIDKYVSVDHLARHIEIECRRYLLEYFEPGICRDLAINALHDVYFDEIAVAIWDECKGVPAESDHMTLVMKRVDLFETLAARFRV